MRTATRMVVFGGCVVGAAGLLTGCDDYDEVKGATIDVPSTVRAGTPFAVTVGGKLGDGAQCPTRYTAEARYKLSSSEAILSELTPPPQGEARIKAFTAVTDADKRNDVDQTVSGLSGRPCSLGNRTHRFVFTPLSKKAQTVKLTVAVYGSKPAANKKQTRSWLEKEITVLPPAAPASVKPAPTAPVANGAGGPRARFIVDADPALTDSISQAFLDARLSTDPDGHIASYSWDLDGDGTYGDNNETGPRAEIIPPPPGATTQTIGLRVTDDSGNTAQTTQTIGLAKTSDADYLGGYTALDDYDPQPNQTVQVEPNVYNATAGVPVEASIDSDGDGAFDDGTKADLQSGDSFPVSYPAGIHEIAVRFRQAGKRTLVYRRLLVVDTITGNARSSRATAAARKAAPLSLSLKLSGARIAKRGRVQFNGPDVTARGTVLKGRVSGGVPRGAARKVKTGLRVLTSGRFALSLNGRARAVGGGLQPRGSSTMVVRSGRSAVCLSLRQSASSGAFRVLGGTGKAKGLKGSGLLVPVTFGDGATPVLASMRAADGKARRLSKACRALIGQAR